MEMTTTLQAECAIPAQPVSNTQRWVGGTMTTLAVLFLVMDAVGKFVQPAAVVEGTIALGYPASVLLGLGTVLLLSTILYAIPPTATLGAILLTGYLGGAVATHLRVGNPLFSHTLFPVYLGVLIWGGLFLRDPKIRALIPCRRR